VIEVSELTKYYGDRKGVGPISFSIESGEIVGLLGLNGAGKTTTLRMLSSDLLPTSGRILIDGVDLIELPEKVRPKIGYLPERPPLYEEMQVQEYLRFAAQLRGVPAAKVEQRVQTAIEVTQLGIEQSTRISELSHGFRQRVGIAQAVVHRPALLLLDEPIKGLDPVQIVEMRQLVRSLGGEHTVVISSHILSEISETCDRLLIIQDGEIIAQGSEQELATKLTPGQSVVVTVRWPAAWGPEGAERATKLASGIAGVKSVSPASAAERGERVAALLVRSEGDVREALCARLSESGLGILGLGRSVTELEDLFLRLLGADGGVAKTVAGRQPTVRKLSGIGRADAEEGA
jgi:ABC-2 type transport system ATP-binding protein